MKRLLLAVSLLAAPLFSASAQANLIFAGGSGTPLTSTLSAPVQYTITTSFAAPEFIFLGTGDAFTTALPASTGSMNFSVNGGGSYGLTQIGSGVLVGELTPTDAFLFGFDVVPPLAVGDVVRLNAGTLTSTVNFPALAPTSRAYDTFIAQDGGDRRSTFGVATTSVVPEPASFALMGAGLLALFGVRTRVGNRKRRA